MFRVVTSILIVAIFLFTSCQKNDDPVSSDPYSPGNGTWETLTTQNSGSNGLPDSNVRRIAVDEDGKAIMQADYKLITTFDGDEWANRDYDSIHHGNSTVYSFYYDRDHTLWLATGYAIFQYSNGDFHIVEETENYAFRSADFGYLSDVFQDRKGVLWFRGKVLILSYDGNDWIAHSDLDSDSTFAYPQYVFEDVNGDIIAYADHRFWKWNGGTEWEVNEFRYSYPYQDVTEFSFDNTGIPLIYIPEDGYYIFKGDHWKQILSDRNYNRADNGFKYTVYKDSEGNRWINLQNTIYCLRNGEYDAFYIRDLEHDVLINEITQAPDGDIWVATTDGLYIYNGSSWRDIKVNGLPDNRENCFAVDSHGEICVVNYNGTFRYYSGEWIEVHKDTNYYVKDVKFDSLDNLWILTIGHVYQYTNQGVWVEYLNVSGENILIDSNDEVFVCSQQGFYKYINGTFGLFVDHPVNTAAEYNGQILIGANFILNTDIELFPYCNDGTNRSQPAINMNFTNHFHDLFADHYGNLWATSVNGISKYDGNKWVTFTGESEGTETFTFNPLGDFTIEYITTELPCDSEFHDVFTFFEYELDEYGNIWFSYNKEIFVYDGFEFKTIIPGVEIPTNIIDITAMDDGSIWFSTKYSGIVKYIPEL